MIEILIFAGGVVVGVLHHAYLQPLIAKAWAWLRDRIAPDSTGG